MRLAYLSPAPRVSTREGVGLPGPRSHLLGFMAACRRRGWQVDQFIVGDRLKPAHVQTVGASVGASLPRRVAGDVIRMGMSWRNGRQALRELLPLAPDAVYERLGVLQSFGWRFQRAGVPWILETNAIHYEEAGKDRRSLVLAGAARRIELAAYRRADLLVVVSDQLRDAVMTAAGVPRERIVVVPNAVELELFPPLARVASPGDGPVIIGFVGSMIPWQALDLLFAAARRCLDQGCRFELRCAGDGPSEAGWRALADELHLPITWVGRLAHHQVPEFLAGVHIGYSGQRRFSLGTMYGSPLKLYEYGAAGVTFVASDHQDARELAAGGELGYVFRSDEVDELAACLMRVWTERAALLTRGERLRDFVRSHHTWDERVGRLVGALQAQAPALAAKL